LIKRKNTTLLRKKLEPVIAEVFGYFSLLYTQDAEELVLNKNLIRNQITLFDEYNRLNGLRYNKKKNNLNLQCKYEELPIASDSIDLILMPTVLQKSYFPHQVLREAERVLIPDGTIVLIINNPIGVTSLKKEFDNFVDEFSHLIKIGNMPNNDKKRWFSLGQRRIKDWLALLSIETISQIAVSQNVIDKSNQLNSLLKLKNKIKQFFYDTFADQIIIVGKKKVSTLTPIRQSWRKNKRFVQPRLAESSVQQHAESCLTQITK
jgi:ubiquinone/menaquinone biosynthesis C-methylase UbiE